MTAASHWVATRAEALRRLDAFLPNAGRAYAERRNFDLGAGDRSFVSQLSPYLRYRLITEPEVIAAVNDHHGAAAASKFIQEVAWRTYWKGWLEQRPAAWTRFLTERDAARADLQTDAARRQAVAEAEAGETGIAGFDDWARELVATGYLHNHARMWFASIWIFTLRLPWALGADFFLRHLMDADPASNTLSWRWVAGLQTKGKTYLATAGNIARYTGGRFEPAGLAQRAEPLTELPLPPARTLPPSHSLNGLDAALLLVTAEDCHPESLGIEPSRIRGVVVWPRLPGWPWGDKAARFVGEAATDTAARVGDHFGCTAVVDDGSSAAMLVATAKVVGAKTVVTAYAPAGPVADALSPLAEALARNGCSLRYVRRPWDERLWPHATRGYFNFKEHLPAGLSRLS